MPRVRLGRASLLALIVSVLLGCTPGGLARANTQPTGVHAPWQETRFSVGCEPGPYSEPPAPDEQASEDAPLSAGLDSMPRSMQLRVDLNSGADRAPILGSGFNLEHGLWSCPAFHQVLDAKIVEPFRPSLARIDTGLLPAAPDDLPASELNRHVYQSVLASRPYAGQWGMLRDLDRAGVRIVLGVWGGPDQFTDDGTRRGVLLPEHYDDYVDYVVSVIDFLVGQRNLPIWAITIGNEPDGGDGNQIPPDGFAYIAHQLAIQLEPYGVMLYGPDTTNADAALDYVPALLSDPVVSNRLAFVGFHQYTGDADVGLISEYVHHERPGLPVIVTEYTSFDFGDLDAGQEATSPLDFTLEVADTLLAHYRLGADAALYWDAVDYLQPGHDAITKWGLLRDPAEDFAPREWYYGLLQILPYLQPGAQVLEADRRGGDDIGLLAVRTADNRLALFLVNQQNDAMNVELDLTGSDAPSRLLVRRTDVSDTLAEGDSVVLSGGSGQVYLPAHSLTTLLS